MFKRIGEFFRVTVSQQRGIAVLVGVLLLFLAAVSIKEHCDESRSERFTLELLQGAEVADSLFFFDPSAADSATFVRLGFSGAQARTIVRYRTSLGGYFHSAEQFSRCRVVSSDMFARLEPYIRIRPQADSPDGLCGEEDFSTVDINRVSLERLRAHGALDARLAGRIFRARQRYGGFVDLRQLMRALPSDSAALRVFSACVRFDTTALVRYQVNRDSESLLAEHPYISRPFARQIVLYRQRHGAVPHYDTLRGLKYFPRSKDEYLRFYLTFDTLENED